MRNRRLIARRANGLRQLLVQIMSDLAFAGA